jgi:hypothetical protein
MSEKDSKVRWIDLESIDTSDIYRILSDYYIDADLGSDGDVWVKYLETFYVKVDTTFQMLRFFSYVAVKNHENPDLSKTLDDINGASSSVKYSTLTNSVMMEYGIPLSGHIDHKLLIKIVRHFGEEMKVLKQMLHEFLEV